MQQELNGQYEGSKSAGHYINAQATIHSISEYINDVFKDGDCNNFFKDWCCAVFIEPDGSIQLYFQRDPESLNRFGIFLYDDGTFDCQSTIGGNGWYFRKMPDGTRPKITSIKRGRFFGDILTQIRNAA